MYIFRFTQNGKPWEILSFFQISNTLHLEAAVRQYDDFFLLVPLQHRTILRAVKSFGKETDNCVLIGSAFEGCFLPKKINGRLEIAVECDFFVQLATPTAKESTGTFQHTQVDGKTHQVLVKMSDPSVIEWEHMGIDHTASYLRHCSDGFYIKRNFMQAMEGKIWNSLSKVYAKKPGGMEIVHRSETRQDVELSASLDVTFFKKICDHLDMLPLDPNTWSGNAMTTAQMLWVNLINWSSSFWPARIFKVHVVLECSWPAVAMENWLQRKRQWPTMKSVQEIALTPCYLHPLWDETGPAIDEEVMAFQITFGRAEFLLFSETGPKERQCIVILKALKEKYFHDSKVFTSHSIKMVFFWHLESTPLAERQEMGRGELLVHLLDKLTAFLESNNLPHFFNPHANLLEGLNACDISSTLKEFKRVQRNLLDYLTSELFQEEWLRANGDDLVQKVLQFV